MLVVVMITDGEEEITGVGYTIRWQSWFVMILEHNREAIVTSDGKVEVDEKTRGGYLRWTFSAIQRLIEINYYNVGEIGLDGSEFLFLFLLQRA